MRIDFYQLGSEVSPYGVIAALCSKLIADGERLLIVAGEESMLARLDRQLWSHSPSSFLPHALSGGADDSRQPILLSTGVDAPNAARNLLLADGRWREAAQHFDRTFYLFDDDSIEEARAAWRSLAGKSESERHYWANVDGKWVEKA
ncbi:DNA polymerase III subunit chi [Sphingomonas sp. HDW15A]|uniref:DNA polymerase III subunit chi n=1 Tax=Sphingomonas sp. HDW15A TaxID=2714942 RepID=UPI00140C70D6|nr:DNA polymerase III subunit chi [Sphingomonas sp. HDW15A]QIK96159.1 DNA polymerase III subunit chi [Sphingomonas sp. HDW15A]